MNIADYRILRTGAGLVPSGDRGWIAVAGDDRADFLQGLLSNDIAALQPGQGCYATCLTPQGRMIADLHVFADRDRLLLDVDRGVVEPLRRRFEDLIFTEDVRLADLTAGAAGFGVHGPRSGEVTAAVAGEAAGRLAPSEYRAFDLDAGAGWLARTDDLGVEGCRVVVERAAGAALRDALTAAGAVPVERAAGEAVRVESGRPAFPIDMDQDTIPLEAGIAERAISFDKGCYVGQEVIVRILHRGGGRVARRLVGLTLASPAGAEPAPPARGAAILRGGDEVGRVTSAVRSPALGAVIALGYVRRELADAGGASVGIASDGGRAEAVVSALPFVPPDHRPGG